MKEKSDLKWASFVIKLKHQASGNSAREMFVAPGFQEKKIQF